MDRARNGHRSLRSYPGASWVWPHANSSFQEPGRGACRDRSRSDERGPTGRFTIAHRLRVNFAHPSGWGYWRHGCPAPKPFLHAYLVSVDCIICMGKRHANQQEPAVCKTCSFCVVCISPRDRCQSRGVFAGRIATEGGKWVSHRLKLTESRHEGSVFPPPSVTKHTLVRSVHFALEVESLPTG